MMMMVAVLNRPGLKREGEIERMTGSAEGNTLHWGRQEEKKAPKVEKIQK